MGRSLTPAAQAALLKARALCGIDGPQFEPMARVWRELEEVERDFWLAVARQPRRLACEPWERLPGDVRDRVKNGLYRAARRASELLASARVAR